MSGYSHVIASMASSLKRFASAAMVGPAFVCLFALVVSSTTAVAESPPQTPTLRGADSLLSLAKKAGFENLTDCEQKLLQSLPNGQFADCQSDNDADNDPSKGDHWPESRRISSTLIRWLCVDEGARKLIDPLGVRIYAAKIPDQLDLSFLSIPFEIDIEKSYFPNGISLMNAQLPALYLVGSYLANPNGDALDANGAKVDGPVFLKNGFQATGTVDLTGATVGSNLDC